jgi:Transposase IS116/IS110/IS902 family
MSWRSCWRRSLGSARCSASPSPPRSARSLASRGPGKLVGYVGLAPRVSQSWERSATGALSKAGSRTLRWAAVEAANQAWRPSNPWHGHYLRISARHGKYPAKSAVARKLLIAAWHMLSRREPFKPHQPAPASSGCFLTA